MKHAMYCKWGMVALAVALAACAVATEGSLVRNGGFEDVENGATVGWNAVGRRYVYVDGAGRSGTRALAFENDDPNFYSFPGQRIELKAGKSYRYEVWVRTEDLKGDESGASICIEWNGPDGKWLGGAYASGVKGTADWTRIQGITPPIPKEAQGFRVNPYVRKGMTGKAWFDDVSVTPYVRAPVTGLYSSAYRNLAASGSVTFKAALCLDLDEYPLSETRGVLRYVGADGKRREAAASISETEAAVTLDVAQLASGAQDVAFALLKGGKELAAATCKFTRAAKMPERAVWFDEFGRTIVDGQPFFPLGMYWSNVNDQKKLDVYAQGPFNCLMPYGAPDQDGLDRCHAKGLKVIYSVKDVFSGTRWAPKGIETEADEVAFVEDRVAKYKNHPAVLAWYLNDELPLSMLPRLVARRDLVERLDPGHPGWVVLYQYNQIADYMPSFDVVGTDPYPIPRPASMAATWTRATRQGTMGLKPLWQVPQAFNWAAYRKTPEEKAKSRAPTPAELRSMAWQCIACGANGLVFYSYFDLYKEPNGEPFARRWAEVCAVAQEVKDQIPVLLATGPAPSVSGVPRELAVRTWGKDGAAYVLVVNTTDEPRTAALELSKPFAAAQRVFGPEPKLSGTSLAFALAQLEPALVRLAPPAPAAERAAVPPQGTELFRCQVHRGGGRNTRPDNALETFLWCWGHGVAPEADARLTKDGVAIALHDDTLKRVGRGISAELASAKIKDLDWAQIRDVDTGSYLDPVYSSTRIPTIDSVFAAMAGRPDRMLYLDEKGAPPELVAELARKHGVERQIYYTSWNSELMPKWQKLVPDGLGMVWLGTWPKNNSPESVARADRFLEESLDRMAAAGWKGVSQVQIHIRTDLSLPDPFCPSSACIRKAIERLHANGVTAQAFTWTEGANKDALRKIWKLGFDNFATDDPLVLFELLPDLAGGGTR